MESRLSPFDHGLLVGILIGQGSFGGDGRQPQIIVRTHVRHEALVRWLVDRFPATRLYGPYHHAQRSYYQWVARGPALVLDVLPWLEGTLGPELDEHAADRLDEMTSRYAGYIERVRARASR